MFSMRLILVLALCFVSLSRAHGAEAVPEVQVGQLPHTESPQEGPEDEARKKFEHDQEKKANQERFRKLKEDTEKLVQLSNELKEYVDKANEHTLSLDVIKKAEEIERLAKSVKDRMKG
jgi:geranylgeranyl pyrophosphate synthase